MRGSLAAVRVAAALAYLCTSRECGMTQPTGSDDAGEAIVRIERQIFEAIKNKDPEALGPIVAEDFVYRTPGGPDLTRARFLESVAALPVTVLSVDSDDMKASVYGDTAILTGVQRSRYRDDAGGEGVSVSAFTDVFVKRDGRWLMVLAYGVDLPPEP
jgi:ketosteroid isomerase-like protein